MASAPRSAEKPLNPKVTAADRPCHERSAVRILVTAIPCRTEYEVDR
jgi:hypothetical protein